MALNDSLFVTDSSKPSHVIIAGLRTHDWYRQNPALAKLDSALANKAGLDSLFVVGRNIYQAACGGANGAISYLNAFMANTDGFNKQRRKALMDGMLFEIFFDSKGNIRAQPKNRYFEEVFQLQQHKELSDSFAFISECLLTHADILGAAS